MDFHAKGLACETNHDSLLGQCYNIQKQASECIIIVDFYDVMYE